MRALLACSALALLACAPELRGECATDVDCPSGTACISGLCLASETPAPDGGADLDGGATTDGGAPTDGGTLPDAGTETCTPACTADFHCAASACVPDFAPEVTITAPAAQARLGGTTLPVKLSARAPGGITKLDVEFLLGTTRQIRAQAQQGATANEWTAQLVTGALPSGNYVLAATLSWGGDDVSATPVPVTLDRDGPTIATTLVLPPRPAGHPAANRFLRTDTVTLDATISDAAGLASSPPTLQFGAQTVNGTSTGAGTWRFTVPATAVPLAGAAGEVSATVRAVDTLGNAAQAAVQVPLSRRAWTFTPASPSAIGAAPAIAGNLLVFGDASGKVRALDRTTGTLAWEVSLGAAVVGHVALGSAASSDGKGPFAYAVTATGHAHWIDTRPDAALQGASRLVFTCPGTLDGAARQPAGGPAIGHTVVSKTDATSEETLFVQAADGNLQMMRRSPLPLPTTIQYGCRREWDVGGNYVSSVPALAEGANTLDVYVADDGGEVRKTVLSRNATTGEYARTNGWSRAYDAGDPVLAPLSLARIGAKVALFIGNAKGRLKVIDEDKQVIAASNAAQVGDRIDAAPAVTNGFAWIVDKLGETQKVEDDTGTKAWTPSVKGSTRSTAAEAGVVVASGGQSHVATGTKLSALSPAGQVSWTFDAQPATVDTVTPALACDGTLYVVANGASGGVIEALQTDAPGLATDGWPRPFHDARNTSNLAGPLAANGACRD